MRATETLTGLVLALFAGVMLVWIIPAEIPRGVAGQLSPRLVPQVAVSGILVLGLWIAGAALVGGRLPAHRPGPFSRPELVALVVLPALVLASIWVLALAGPVPAGVLLVAGAALLMGERRPVALILLPAGSLTLGWVLLYRILGTTVG
ncbi:MAG: hypothetical protein H6899_10575 [Rhodobacter sp.]|nr:hypothetical protein [Paracoccaceae bacterium]MCC0080371.1 hypothetical protein [Rhodobacter sp.]